MISTTSQITEWTRDATGSEIRAASGILRIAPLGQPSLPSLSVIVPAFDEERRVGLAIERLLETSGMDLEVIVVDDGSRDGAARVIEAIAKQDARVCMLRHDRNYGKGTAIRTALPYARGGVVAVHDADLECDARDLAAMLRRFAEPATTVVYGSRWLDSNGRRAASRRSTLSRVAAAALSSIAGRLFHALLTDLPTASKMFRTNVLRSLELGENRFGFCAEVTAQVLARGHHIVEVPVSYAPRTRREGKKVRWPDGLRALWVLLSQWWHLRRQRGLPSEPVHGSNEEARP